MSRFALGILAAALFPVSASADLASTDICKAAVAKMMGRPVSIMTITRSAGDVHYLSYRRDDGTQWAYRCRLQGDRIIWGSEPNGRWRDQREDEVLTFRHANGGNTLVIRERFSDGFSSEQSFRASDFRRPR